MTLHDQPINTLLNDEQVMQYLLEHPDFFIRNARQVEQLQVPHPVRGSVSLVEWNMARQRHQIHLLEEEITLLMEQASANEQLFSRLFALYHDLIQSASLKDLLSRLQQWAKSIGLAGADIRLFDDRWQLQPPSEFYSLALSRQRFESLRIQRMANNNHYLGTLNGPEILLLLPNAVYVGSVAISMLGRYGDLGLVIFSSRNTQHYQQGMGTLLLEHLSLLLPIVLKRWINLYE